MDSSDAPAHATPHPLKIFDACRRKDEFVYACAPMVRYSKLAFRQTVHHYGTHLCWTPMILAKEFNRSEFARDSAGGFKDLTVASAQQQQPQPPTIVQFGANVPVEFARAASLAAPFVAGVDLNCGCPQGWACAETLGAALMDRRELVRDMVVEARGRLARDGWAVGLERDMDSEAGRSVSVKIRVHDDLRRTIDFLDTVIGSGSGDAQHRNVDWITIHPRTRHTPSTTPISTSSLAILLDRYSARVPILLSGDVFDLGALPAGLPGITTSTFTTNITTSTASDTTASSSSGGGGTTTTSGRLSGFMSARGLLANPALFAAGGHASCPWEAVEVLMCRLSRAPLPYKLALHHVQQMTGPGMGPNKHSLLSKKERAQLNALPNMLELVDFLDGAVERYTGRAGGMRRDL